MRRPGENATFADWIGHAQNLEVLLRGRADSYGAALVGEMNLSNRRAARIRDLIRERDELEARLRAVEASLRDLAEVRVVESTAVPPGEIWVADGGGLRLAAFGVGVPR